MGEVITLPTRPQGGALTLVEEHGQALDALAPLTLIDEDGSKLALGFVTIDGYSRLLPRDTLMALRREIEVSL
jgi:hypothetical protein